jgi:DNA-binding MarR family transcriptional regulator
VGDDELGAELRRAVFRLYSRFRSERLDGEVPDAALLVLVVLGKRGGIGLTELAEIAHVSLGSMTQTVRRLESLALVSKTRGVEDRRTVAFSLTDEGRAAVEASKRHRRDWLGGRLSELTDAERDLIVRAAPLLLRIADS